MFSEFGNPTSVDFVRCDSSQIVAAYVSSDTQIYDLETGSAVTKLESKVPSGKSKVCARIEVDYQSILNLTSRINMIPLHILGKQPCKIFAWFMESRHITYSDFNVTCILRDPYNNDSSE